MKGKNAMLTSATLQEATNAIMIPVISVNKFWILNPITEDARLLTICALDASSSVRFPGLFSGVSNHLIGIFNIFSNKFLLIYKVRFSPTIRKRKFCNPPNINTPIAK